MTTPQLLTACIGSAIALAGIAVFWGWKTHRFKALFWLAIGGAMIFAAFRPHLIDYLGEDTPELRLRLLVALLSFIVLTITLEAIRVSRMQERYAFLWLATGMLLLAGAVFACLAEVVTRATGMPYALIVMVVLFAFIVLMLFSFSLALSRLQAKQAEIARALALTEARLRRVEGEKARNAELTAREVSAESTAERPPRAPAADRFSSEVPACAGTADRGTGGADRLADECPIREVGPAVPANHERDPSPQMRNRIPHP